MEKRVGKLVKDPKVIAIGILGVIAVVLLFMIFGGEKIEPFNIQDRCGIFVNLESHTIADADACKSQCRARCISQDYEYKKIEFEEPDGSCNRCKCFCK